MTDFKPMLAGKFDADKQRFPAFVSPKLDGIRAVVRGGKLLSRKLIEIPNRFISASLDLKKMEGYDGELIVGSPTASDCYNTTLSGVMSRDGDPLRFLGRAHHLPQLKGPMNQETDPNGMAQHTPGAKLDAGKPLPNLVLGAFASALAAVTDVGTYGAQKYTPRGWQYVPDGVERYSEALMRHWLAEQQGEAVDAQTGLLHAAHLAWNALARLSLMLAEADVVTEPRTVNVDEELEKQKAASRDRATPTLDELVKGMPPPNLFRAFHEILGDIRPDGGVQVLTIDLGPLSDVAAEVQAKGPDAVARRIISEIIRNVKDQTQ